MRWTCSPLSLSIKVGRIWLANGISGQIIPSSIHPSIYPSIHPSFYQLSIYPPIHLPMHLSIHNFQPLTCLPIYLSSSHHIHSSIHPSTHPLHRHIVSICYGLGITLSRNASSPSRSLQSSQIYRLVYRSFLL